MTVSADILEFSGTREAWQQDLLRRIYTLPDLTKDDLAEVLSMIKAKTGILKPDQAKVPLPLDTTHVLHRHEAAPRAILLSMGEVAHANQLAPNQTMPFATTGLTVVFGENGSGKTGLTRILKGACRVRRERVEPVLSNVFTKGEKRPAEATIRFQVGGGDVELHRWRDGSPAPDALSRISVFDAATAPLYADKQNEIEYLPQGLDVLPRLAKACEDLVALINADLAMIDRGTALPLPKVPDGTAAAALLAKLTSNVKSKDVPTEGAINAAVAWDIAVDGKRLQEITSDLASDPAAQAVALRRCILALQTVGQECAQAETALGDASADELRRLIHAASVARQAANVAASDQFKGEMLEIGIGGEAWRNMFGYAKEFFTLSSSGDTFPPEKAGAPCPLCQQPLGNEAHTRMCRFEAFVQDKARKDANRRSSAVAAKLDTIRNTRVTSAADIHGRLAEFSALGDCEADIATTLASICDTLVIRRDLVLMGGGEGALPDLPKAAVYPKTEIANALARLTETALAREKAAQDPNWRTARLTEKAELEARRSLSSHLQSLLDRRGDLLLAAGLRACVQACTTTPISRKNSELRDRYLTAEFQKRVLDEMDGFGIGYLPIKIVGRTDRGRSLAGPALDAVEPVRCSSILSDGEFRAVALACFLAEVGGMEHEDGIIIDDPVSSLDHNHSRQVALRLVNEARRRQVLVFTHDISFYYEVWVAATAAQVMLARHWIRHTAEHGFGTVFAGDAPWQAKSTKDRLTQVEDKLLILRKVEDRKTEGYRNAVTDLYTDLRETWERLVEEKLLNGVVGRFQPGVSTQALRGVNVTDADHKTVYLGMQRASDYSGHDQARGRTVVPPNPEDIAKDIEHLRAYMRELNGRVDVLARSRKEQEAPPLPVYA